MTAVMKYFRGFPFRVRLFIRLRYLSVPWKQILSEAGTPESVFDFGCGHGLFVALLHYKIPYCRITACDHDRVKADYARQLEKTRKGIRVAECVEITNTEATYDLVTVHDVLYCIPPHEHQDLISKLVVMLKPGGILMLKETVSRPWHKALVCRIQEFLALKIFRYTKGSYVPLLTPEHYLDVLEKAGMQLIQARPLGRWYPWPHYIFLGKKLNRG